ncbi:hypothetical protein GCM10023184_00180 [Flaviaesturariibacter amylovorans]|uniref:Uncharacterized protein n=1 Tax=Flaviaesturariibacter amylovorans TaxID=1084520 RepID=A0ABP8G3V8_9BACT
MIFVLLSCKTRQKPSIDSWVGEYSYEEEPLDQAEVPAPSMLWEFAVAKSGDSTLGTLDVNGFQTFTKARAQLTGDSSALYVIFDRDLDGSSTWKRGDTLFVLSRKEKSTITTWKRATPMLRENPPKTCECF